MSEKLLPEKLQKENKSEDKKAEDAETPLKKEEGENKDIQSTNNKKKAIYGNGDDKYKDSCSNVNEFEKDLEQINQSEEKSHPTNSCREKQSIIIKINFNHEDKTPKEPASNCNIILKEYMNNPELKENLNQKSTGIYDDDKNSLQPERKENIIVQPNNNFNKNKSRESNRILSRKHTIETSDIIHYFKVASKKDKNNIHITYKTNFIKNNKFLQDNFLLYFYEISYHNEQQNISCSEKKLIEKSLLSVKMKVLLEAGVGMDEYPIQKSTPNYDGNEGDYDIDNDIDKVSQNDIKICQNLDANYGLYKKECEKGMRTVNDFLSNSISSSF